MSGPMQGFSGALDELGLEAPFAEGFEPEAASIAGEYDTPFGPGRDGEDLAWLDVEAPASDAAATEAEWLEPPAASTEFLAHGDEAYDEAPCCHEHEWGERDEYERDEYELDGREHEEQEHRQQEHDEQEWGEDPRTTLASLLANEAGAGSALADRMSGVAELALGPTLRRGNSGSAVAALQRALVALGHEIAVDGAFGPNTERAVIAFQLRSGLAADGVVGPATKAALAAALGGKSAPLPPGPAPTPGPSPAPPSETLDAFVTRLGNEWSRRRNGDPAPGPMADWLRADYADTLQGARARFGQSVSEDAIRRGWMTSREEHMRFQTEPVPGAAALANFRPPAAPVTLVSDKAIGGSDKAPVAPVMVRFVEALRRRYGERIDASNYRGHGSYGFVDKGYSLDLYISGKDERGFFPQQRAIAFLRALDDTAKAMGAQWRVIYNDYAVARTINAQTRRANVIFVGSATRDKNKRVTGINWHGPAPLILHFHLDLAPPDGGAQDEEEGDVSHVDGGEAPAASESFVAFERLVDHETAPGTPLAERLKGVASLMFGPTLRRGDTGAGVAALQRALASLGASIDVDGDFGPATQGAVRAFQSRSGLDADGIAGPRTKAALAAALGGKAAPIPPPSPTPLPVPAPSAGDLAQADVTTLAAVTFADAAQIDAFFHRRGNTGFIDWYNATLSRNTLFANRGAIGTTPTVRDRFTTFWNQIPAAYDRSEITLLDFAAMMAISINETGGNMFANPERGGAGRKDADGKWHRGLAYFFDAIDRKASYNHLSGGRTAGDLFDDADFIRAHGMLGGADRLAHHGGEFGGAWNGKQYPQAEFSTNEDLAENGFIMQADFYKFRGRGVIQTTGRESYRAVIQFVQRYAGSNPVLLDFRRRWSGTAADVVATTSRNDDWDRVFAQSEILAKGLSLHARARGDYRQMSTNAALLNAVPVPEPGSKDPRKRNPDGQAGSIYAMGRRISGSYAYGSGIYRQRVLALLRGMRSLA